MECLLKVLELEESEATLAKTAVETEQEELQ